MSIPSEAVQYLEKEISSKLTVTSCKLESFKTLSATQIGAVLMRPNGRTLIGVSPSYVSGTAIAQQVPFFLIDITELKSIKTYRPTSPGNVDRHHLTFTDNGSTYVVLHNNPVKFYFFDPSVAIPGVVSGSPCNPEYFILNKMGPLPVAPLTPKVSNDTVLIQELDELRSYITKWSPKKKNKIRVVIGILGRMRIGKSSFINSVFSALEGQVLIVDEARPGALRTTKQFKKIPLTPQIVLATNEGYESNDDNFQFITRYIRITEGSEPEGADMEAIGDILVPETERERLDMILHVFCESPDPRDVVTAKSIHAQLTKRGFDSNQSHYAMTMLDKLQVPSAGCVADYINSDAARRARAALASPNNGLGVDETRIQPVISVHSWLAKTQSETIDAHAAVLVLRVIKRMLQNYDSAVKVGLVSGLLDGASAPAEFVNVEFNGKKLKVRHLCTNDAAGLTALKTKVVNLIKENFDPDCIRVRREVTEEDEVLVTDQIVAGTKVIAVKF